MPGIAAAKYQSRFDRVFYSPDTESQPFDLLCLTVDDSGPVHHDDDWRVSRTDEYAESRAAAHETKSDMNSSALSVMVDPTSP